MKAAILTDADTATGQRQLWCAVILRAVEDATSTTPSVERSQARAWLTGYSRDFATVCNFADQEADRVRAIATRLIAEAEAIKPTASRGRRYDHEGLSLTIADWSSRTGIPTSALRMRLKSGWTFEAAVTTPTNKPGRPKRKTTYDEAHQI